MVICDGSSAEQKTLGILFRTLPRKRKQLGIPFSGTKIEANSKITFRTLLRKRKQLEIPFHGTKKEENSWISIPKHSAEEFVIPFRGTQIETNSRNVILKFPTIPRKIKQLRTKRSSHFYHIFTQFVAEYSKRGRVRGRVWMNYTLIKPNLRSMWVHSATCSCINEPYEKWYTLAVFAKLEFSRGFPYI